MICRSADSYDDFCRNERDAENMEKLLPHCSLCGSAITGDYYKHVHIRGLEYILCDDCLEEDSVDSYVDAQRYGY